MMMDLQLRGCLGGDKGVRRIEGRKGDMCNYPGTGGVAILFKELKEVQ